MTVQPSTALPPSKRRGGLIKARAAVVPYFIFISANLNPKSDVDRLSANESQWRLLKGSNWMKNLSSVLLTSTGDEVCPDFYSLSHSSGNLTRRHVSLTLSISLWKYISDDLDMSRVCHSSPTLTSARRVTSDSRSVSYHTSTSIDRPVVTPVVVLHTTCGSIVYRVGTVVRTSTSCAAYYITGYSTIPGKLRPRVIQFSKQILSEEIL